MVLDYYDSISGRDPQLWSITPNITDDQPVELPAPFDLLGQRMFFALSNGTARSFDFNQLDDELRYSVQWSTVYGITIGMSIMTLLHVLALTPVTKRRTLIYWMNLVGLSLVFIRGIFQTVFFRDAWVSFYVTFSGDAATVPVLHKIHLTASVFLGLATLTTVEILFFIQGRAILSSLQKKFYYPLMSTLVFVGVMTCAAKLVYVSYSMKDVWILRYMPVNSTNIPDWVQPISKFDHVCMSFYAYTDYPSSLYLCAQHWVVVAGLVLLHWKTNPPSLENEHDAWKDFWCNERLVPRWHSVYDYPQLVPIPFRPPSLLTKCLVFFLVMQFVPYDQSFWGAEGMVIPSVLCLMPFSCLWAGTISSTTGQGCDEPRSVGHGALHSTAEKMPFGKGLLTFKQKAFNNDPEANLSGDTAAVHHEQSGSKRRSSNHIDKLYPTNDTQIDDEDEINVMQTYHLHEEHSSPSDPNRSSSSK